MARPQPYYICIGCKGFYQTSGMPITRVPQAKVVILQLLTWFSLYMAWPSVTSYSLLRFATEKDKCRPLKCKWYIFQFRIEGNYTHRIKEE